MVTKGGRLEQARIMWDFFFNKPADTRPSGENPAAGIDQDAVTDCPGQYGVSSWTLDRTDEAA
jgi:hypothetical protein